MRDRLFDSAKIYSIEMPYDAQQIIDACKTVVAANGLDKGAYLRPIVFRGYGEIGVTPKVDPPTEVAIAAIEWGAYLGAEGAAERRRRVRFVLAARGTQHHSGARQGRRKLPVEPAHRARGTPPRVCRRHRPDARRPGERRRRRESVPRQGWCHLYARPRLLDPGRHYPRLGR